MKTKKQRRSRKQKFHTKKKKSIYNHGASFVLSNTPVYEMSKECFGFLVTLHWKIWVFTIVS